MRGDTQIEQPPLGTTRMNTSQPKRAEELLWCGVTQDKAGGSRWDRQVGPYSPHRCHRSPV